MNADSQMPNAPRKVRIQKGAQNAAQALADRLARGLPRWAAKLARKVARQPARVRKSASLTEQSPNPFHYHAD